mgnify:FL=1
MGRIREFYDALMYRRAPIADEDLLAVGPSSDSRLHEILDLTDADYILVNTDDYVISCSETVSNIGLVKNNRITSEAIRKLIRSARNKNEIIESEVAIPRGVIAAGYHERRVRIGRIGKQGEVAALIFDDSEADRLDAVRRDFVANISHELKTPIGGISILAEAISEGSEDPVLVKNFSERMKIEANRLSNLVQEIIDLSRIQDQDAMQNAVMLQLNSVIEEAIYQSKVRAEKKAIEINFVTEDQVDFFGDKKQIVMAISNLIENAINYSPERTVVTIVLKRSDDFAEITIKDQGVGIAETDLNRIFERFYRVDAARSRETGGTGLGLSIVKHVISNHGGDIQVWSAPGTGSTFTVLLPIVNSKRNDINENEGER